MNLPPTVFDPPFRITRASHVALTVRDLAASRTFYSDVIGLVLTAQDDDTLYFRGTEEALDRAKSFFDAKGCATQWAEVRFQGRTLHVTDVAGVPLELCARMRAE